MIHRLSFKNPNAGKQPRAIFYRRWARQIKRKRVAYARAKACATLDHAAKQLARVDRLAAVYDVPVPPMPALPTIPLMPGRDYIEHLRHMGPLKDPVMAQPIAPPGAQTV